MINEIKSFKRQKKIIYTIHFYQGKIFFCLFVWSLSSHSRIFHSYGNIIIAGDGLQMLT